MGLIASQAPVARSMSSSSGSAFRQEGEEMRRVSSASMVVKKMTKPIGLVTKIQRDVASSAYQEMEEKVSGSESRRDDHRMRVWGSRGLS